MSNHTKAGRRRSFRERARFTAEGCVVLRAERGKAEARARYLSRASRPELSPEERWADVLAEFLAARAAMPVATG